MLTRARMLAAMMLLAGWGGARAQTVELRVSHYLPPNHTVQKVLEDWGRELERRSGGRLKLRIFPAAQLGPVQRQFDLARNGQVDMAVGLTGATPGRYPLTEVASLPFVHPAAGTASEVVSRRLTELAPKYLAAEYAGLRVLWAGATPGATFFTSRREIDAAADARGLKIRFQGELHAKLLRALGAVPLQVPPGEVADDMAKGVIDGAIFNYEGAESFGLANVTHHVMEPAFVTATLLLVMNPAKYDALPPDLRAIIDDTTGPEAAAALGRRWDAAEQHGRQYMLDGHVGINTVAPADLEALQKALAPVTDEAVAALDHDGKPGRAFLADFTR